MPTLDVSKKDFEKLVGKKFDEQGLEEVLEYVKCEIDSVDGNNLKVDCKETNRPDLWSTEGLAREIRARIGKEKGIRKYVVGESSVNVFVDSNLEKVRPFIACAVLKGVKVDGDFVVQMVQLQEKICETFGRKRKEAAIGLYDFDVMKPPVYYKGFKDNEIEFVPLEWKVPMRPSEIISQHEKGKIYGWLVQGSAVYPIVMDANKMVASMPPIINSNATGKVTEKTKNLFVEVTGFSLETIETALEVMCMALADRGGKIYSCKINYSKGKIYPKTFLKTPRFLTKKISFEKALVEKKTGLKLNDAKVKELLERARYNVKIDAKKIVVEYSSCRTDILHPVDVIEDLLISYGFNKIVPRQIKMSVIGSQLKEISLFDSARDACVGIGLQEVLTYNLTSKEIQGKNFHIDEQFVEIANPVSLNYGILRKRLAPQLVNFLAKNKSELYPQRIFEVGTCLELDKDAPNGVKQTTNLCVALSSSKVNFTDIKSALVSICNYLNLKVELRRKEFPFMGENCAEIIVNGKKGFIGEINKKTLENFGIKNQVALLEFPLN
ncbi:MAG: phenylalanine--tRNA ligase subunit beta [Candidatus Diapherotrites archaeon]|nr:phenylalanine--tRNA ligase subunit beta [Candidatus Diapherotrites archaeon]